jgi:hypothetical protein
MPLFLYSLTFWSGVAAGGTLVWFLPKLKAWFTGEVAKAEADIKSKL